MHRTIAEQIVAASGMESKELISIVTIEKLSLAHGLKINHVIGLAPILTFGRFKAGCVLVSVIESWSSSIFDQHDGKRQPIGNMFTFGRPRQCGVASSVRMIPKATPFGTIRRINHGGIRRGKSNIGGGICIECNCNRIITGSLSRAVIRNGWTNNRRDHSAVCELEI